MGTTTANPNHHAAGPATAPLDISAVIPVYRGEKTIVDLCRRLIKSLEELGCTFEIILVDDGSKDNSWARVCEMAKEDPRVLGARLTRNFGQHNATLAGFRLARGKQILTMDEDGQHPPEEFHKLLAHAKATGSDVVYGIPQERRHSWWRRLGSRMIMIVPRVVMKINFDIAPYRLIAAPIAAEVAKATRHDIIIDVYFAWLTDRITATHVTHAANQQERRSSYTIWHLLRILMNMLFNYTVLPLRVASIIGILLSIASILLAFYFIFVKVVQGVDVPGFTAIIVSVLFSTGVVLLAIGMVSEYLARTFLYINHKPQSAIRLTTREVNDVTH